MSKKFPETIRKRKFNWGTILHLLFFIFLIGSACLGYYCEKEQISGGNGLDFYDGVGITTLLAVGGIFFIFVSWDEGWTTTYEIPARKVEK